MAIVSFSDEGTRTFFLTGICERKTSWRSIAPVARRKLDMLHYAHELSDLRSPPGNRLEPLQGKLKGYHSIRINDQWRIIFQWTSAGPALVSICDYHS